jgi:DnaJ-class molecular chaperone
MDEISYNTPIFGKDKEYTECEFCDGDGWVWFEEEGYDDRRHQIACLNCKGEGQIEIED